MTALVIATDEDVANRAIGDWPLIAPRFQRLAAGADGSFSAGSLWTLNSASNNFTSAGVARGHLVIFAKDAANPSTSPERVDDILAVESVSGTAATLRRPGMSAGLGSPYPPVGGVTGKPFRIVTCDPQIARATEEFQRQYGIETAADLGDPKELRRVIVLAVLVNLYFDASRNLAEQSDDFGTKYKYAKSDLKVAVELLDEHYGFMNASVSAASGLMAASLDTSIFPYSSY